MRLDLEHEWPFGQHQYDIVLSLGLLCHLKNYEQHIKNICDAAEYVVLETEVLDVEDSDVRMPRYEEKIINDLSFHGEGSLVSANNIQNRLSGIGATYKRLDNPKVNSGSYRYDWRESGAGRKVENRRIWFIRRDKFIAKKLENQPKIEAAENRLLAPIVASRLGMPVESLPNNSPHARVLNRVEQRRILSNNKQRPQYITPMNQPSSQPKIRLFFNYYEDKNPARKKEIDYCLQKNIENQLLDIIILQSDIALTFNLYFEKINRITGPN